MRNMSGLLLRGTLAGDGHLRVPEMCRDMVAEVAELESDDFPHARGLPAVQRRCSRWAQGDKKSRVKSGADVANVGQTTGGSEVCHLWTFASDYSHTGVVVLVAALGLSRQMPLGTSAAIRVVAEQCRHEPEGVSNNHLSHIISYELSHREVIMTNFIHRTAQAFGLPAAEIETLQTPEPTDVGPKLQPGSKAPSTDQLRLPNGKKTLVVFLRHCGCPCTQSNYISVHIS